MSAKYMIEHKMSRYGSYYYYVYQKCWCGWDYKTLTVTLNEAETYIRNK